MENRTEHHFHRTGGLVALWAGLLAGPLAWALDQQVKYMALTYICSAAGLALLHVVTLLTILLAAGGGWLSWRSWRQAGREAPDDGGSVLARSRFMAAMGLSLSLFFALIIIAQWLPSFFFNPCERGS